MASKSEAEALAQVAATLGRRAAREKRDAGRRPAPWPDLWLVTDPARIRDPAAAASRLPRGAGVIYRAFGAAEAETTGAALAAVARQRGLTLLVGADPKLAHRIGAHGVHLPQRLLRLAPRIRAQNPGWRLTGAAHDARALIAGQRFGLDAMLLSPVFPSRSPSAARILGPLRFARLAVLVDTPVYALGGLDVRTARRLLSTRAAGLAAVDGLAHPPVQRP